MQKLSNIFVGAAVIVLLVIFGILYYKAYINPNNPNNQDVIINNPVIEQQNAEDNLDTTIDSAVDAADKIDDVVVKAELIKSKAEVLINTGKVSERLDYLESIGAIRARQKIPQ